MSIARAKSGGQRLRTDNLGPTDHKKSRDRATAHADALEPFRRQKDAEYKYNYVDIANAKVNH